MEDPELIETLKDLNDMNIKEIETNEDVKRVNFNKIECFQYEFKEKLNEIVKLMDTINKRIADSGTDIKTVTNPDSVSQFIETVKMNVTNIENGLNINPKRYKLEYPISDDISKTPVGTQIPVLESVSKIIDTFKKDLEKVKETITAGRTVDDDEIERNNSSVLKESEKIKTITDDLKRLNEEYESNKILINKLEIDTSDITIGIKDGKIDTIDNIVSQINKDLNIELYTKITSVPDSDSKKKVKQIDIYNREIMSVTDKGDLPSRLFDGRYTVRIENNILNNDPKLLDSQLNGLVGLISNIDTEYKADKTKNDIYMPELTTMVGGNKLSDYEMNVLKYDKLGSEYLTENKKYRNNIAFYNRAVLNNLIHNIFLMLVLTNQIFTDGYVIYKYINKGIVEFYRRVLNNIMTNVNSLGKKENHVLYMRKYHLFTILKLHDFINKLATNMTHDTILEIDKIRNSDVRERFMLLNYFKNILDNYNELFQNKITIYSRINDIGDNSLIKKFFRMHDTDSSKMILDKTICSSLEVEDDEFIKEIKFTEVFDTPNFPNNGDISKYMTLDTQLSKGKGVSIITYGYSGTGKTYTLFGNNESNKEGMLQSTLDNINGLEEVQFRLYELYGRGIPFMNYWKNEDGTSRMDKINHEIYVYNLIITAENLDFNGTETKTASDIATFIGKKTDKEFNDSGALDRKYISIKGKAISEIFRNFDNFMKKVENNRKKKQTIRDTPNNIVSSRSVLIYDFMLKIKINGTSKYVPFLIIDMPGREEIESTYVNTYIENNYIKELIKPPAYLKLMLLSMTLNPLAVGIFDPDTFMAVINKKGTEMLKIYDTELNFKYTGIRSDTVDIYSRNVPDNIITGIKSGAGSRGFKMMEEIINIHGNKLEHFFKLQSDGKIEFNDPMGNKFGHKYKRPSDSKRQYFGFLTVHIMNRLILLNRFDIIKEIYEKLVHKNLNQTLLETTNRTYDTMDKMLDFMKKLIETNFKADKIKKLEGIAHIMTYDNLKKNLNDIIKYDYLLTVFEGIYINENIIGLIKFMSEKMITDRVERDTFIKEKIKKQNDQLNFQYQHKIARMWLISDVHHIPISGPEKKNDTILESNRKTAEFFNLKPDELRQNLIKNITTEAGAENIIYNDDNIMNEYKKTNNGYKSDSIFNFDKPLITDILEYYLEKINDYKVFYLFGNYESTTTNLKCINQYKLLKDTQNFINTLA
jgi:hypothetical protein